MDLTSATPREQRPNRTKSTLKFSYSHMPWRKQCKPTVLSVETIEILMTLSKSLSRMGALRREVNVPFAVGQFSGSEKLPSSKYVL